MTEDWLACDDPDKMLSTLIADGALNWTARKGRLFNCACCRRIWTALMDPRSREAVEVAERHADGLATDDDLFAAYEAARVAERETFAAQDAREEDATVRAAWAAVAATGAAWDPDFYYRDEYHPFHSASEAAREVADNPVAEKSAQCKLLLDIFGNPYVPPLPLAAAVLARNGGAAVTLAQSIYDGRRFADLPILADTLEEAGAANQVLLDHLRGPGPHVRGCWAVDAVLGKS
jgi:hypothetical protein